MYISRTRRRYAAKSIAPSGCRAVPWGAEGELLLFCVYVLEATAIRFVVPVT